MCQISNKRRTAEISSWYGYGSVRRAAADGTAAECYVLGVVEQSAVPEVMEAASVVVEEAAIRAVELVQSVNGVLARVAVDHIKQDDYTTSMCYVDQLFQLIWRSTPTTTSQ